MKAIKIWLAFNSNKLLLPFILLVIIGIFLSTLLLRTPLDIKTQKEIEAEVVSFFNPAKSGTNYRVTATTEDGENIVAIAKEYTMLKTKDKIILQEYKNIISGNKYFVLVGKKK